MIAYRFQRFYSCAFPCFKKTGLLLGKFIVCLALLTACQTKKAVSKEAGAENQPAIAQKSLESVKSTSTRKPGGAPAPAPTEKTRPALPPPRPQPLAEVVGERLRSSFEVMDIDGKSIRVGKSTAKTAAPSLFEEAIILGKLRAFLKSSTASANQSVTFHNGTATVSFPPKINSGTASVLIAKMLSLDGVNEVRAGFGD
jgi:type IV secretory pathway VirB10-like protein